MDISTAHADARDEAARIPALQASLDLLAAPPGPGTIAIYAAPRPAPGAAPGAAALVTIPLAAGAGTIDPPTAQIVLATPIEAQIDADGAGNWARIYDGAGAWWADASVSNTAGTGEIKLDDGESVAGDAQLAAGAFARLVSAVLQG
ncbi:MAG: hypothetical protein ROZ37_21220 [Aromatoleum sp.]|uniref:hypothetical protein n=1 Tax=Aromatoleum sp. TaxID=2307007 RepID=UPI0028939AA9|nr:hypothetical protein [Aromatoleum sp.]MDT3672847.1 hypothetical protein [Aromatoleum sp.]